jgi:hypothetical protein
MHRDMAYEPPQALYLVSDTFSEITVVIDCEWLIVEFELIVVMVMIVML